ncbi:NACHT and WD domain protein, partial [Apiospora aurea]
SSSSSSKPSTSLTRRFSRRLSLRFGHPKSPEQPKRNQFGLNTVFEPPEPSDVVADFVFIHGLGGGSSKTWSCSHDPDCFWPERWLPQDDAFQGVRIHSFGYDANWKSFQATQLDVHSFGEYLMEELASNPKIRDQDTNIVLLGHSMGGLVIKKACILARTNPGFSSLSRRFHSFYFLGTPHKGAGLATTLNNILHAGGTNRHYITGLEAKSELIRVLNDQFRLHYYGIRLHTFYETQPIQPLGIVVDYESATLGYAEERSQLLNANHRDLTKFSSTEESNYRSLRNRLAITAEEIRAVSSRPLAVNAHTPDVARTHEEPHPPESTGEQMRAVESYLCLHQTDEILSTLDDARLNGSCFWLTQKPSFREWLGADAPRYYWLKGPPACGKSIIASHVIDRLRGFPTCSYFFKTGERVTSNLSTFLRSMAYQMARVNPVVREALFLLTKQGTAVDVRSHKSIWHNVFTGCIFQKEFNRPHYWVIDALDEASDGGSLDDYWSLLAKIENNVPLKVFITSRPGQAIELFFAALPTIAETVRPEDSLQDIRLYVEKDSPKLPVTDGERQQLINRIVEKSGGSFLWIVLVMQKLRDVVTTEEVHDVLDRVPDQMSELYTSNIRRLESGQSYQADEIVKHIITWAICSMKTLTVDEMKDVIKIGLGTTVVRDLKVHLPYLSGQFLDVDKQSNIRVVHETARAFLTMSTLNSPFRVDLPDGHRLVATTCLKYLLSEDLKYSKRKRSVVASSGISKVTIADYACQRFSEHIFRASSASNELFNLLQDFFCTNVLSWIECVAHLRDLDCLIRTSRHLSSYLSRRAKHTPVVPEDLSAWVLDLPRIVTQFGVNLLSDPSSIHTLVPPFCPRESAVYRHFGYAEDGIKLVGAWNSGWDDRICSLVYHETNATALATLDERFAVGFSDGTIRIYRTSTCQEMSSINHGESVRILEFGATAKLLASSGLHYVKLWNVASGTELLSVRTESQTLAMALTETGTSLVAASRDKQITSWRTANGSRVHTHAWADTFIDAKEPGNYLTPNAVKISLEHQLMVVVYRSKPVQLYSLERQRPIGACIRQETNKHSQAGHLVHSAILNPNPAYQRLVVSYWDQCVVTFDTTTCKPVASVDAGLDGLAISPNGKTLVGYDGFGGIKLYDFETLQFLYEIPMKGDPITSIAFTSDNLRLIDVRGAQTNVWEPMVLVSQDADSNGSEPSDSVRRIFDEPNGPVVDQSVDITVIHCCEACGIAFCGRNNGRVDTCNLDNPRKTMRNIYKHRGGFTSVTCLDWSYKSKVAVSADTSGHFRVMQIKTGERRQWSAKPLLESTLGQGCSISQVLLDPAGALVLVSSSGVDMVWSISKKAQVASVTGRRRIAWKWFNRPLFPSQVILVEDNLVKILNWADLMPIVSAEDATATLPAEIPYLEAQVEADAISISSEGGDLIFAQRLPLSQSVLYLASAQVTTTKVLVLDLSSPVSSTTAPSLETTDLRRTRNVANIPDVDYIIGTVKRFNLPYLVFISCHGWVCSVELGDGLSDTGFQKHFFIPSVWRTGNSTFTARVRKNQDIIIIHNDGVIVIKNGLDNGDHISVF